MNVDVGLYLHQTTRSKKLIDIFSGLNLSISYKKVIDIKKDVANAILEKRDENKGVFIPLCLFPSQRPFFGIDNTDMKIFTPTGKDNFMVQQWQHFNNTYMTKLTLSCKYKENLNDTKQMYYMKT